MSRFRPQLSPLEGRSVPAFIAPVGTGGDTAPGVYTVVAEEPVGNRIGEEIPSAVGGGEEIPQGGVVPLIKLSGEEIPQ